MPASKTPKFDALIDKILDDLVQHERVCADCGKEFKIEAEDITFLKMFRVPPPKLCPQCRQRRRLSFVNYSNIYKRKCDVPGHSETMISQTAPVMPWVTYDHDTYYSDSWDPFSYGMDIKTGEPFLGQFLELLRVVPQPGVRRGSESPNSDYSFYGKHMKDCYYVFGGRRSEDIMYGSAIYDSRHIVDSYFVRNVELSYDNVSTNNCHKCKHAYFSSDCIDCDFIYDCRNCQNCFGCVNLRNKNYCWYNEQLSKEEFEKRKKESGLSRRSSSIKYSKEFWKLVKNNPVRASRVFQSENVSGNDIKRCRDCRDVFQIEDSENVRHSGFVLVFVKDSMDMSLSGHVERIYDSQNVGTTDVKFSFGVKGSSECEYSMNLNDCQNCFGCIGLRSASYSIFNKKYSPEEYWKKLDDIKSDMLERGEYGEFFSMPFSPMAYNSSLAHILYPMSEEEAKKRGLYWQEETDVDTKGLNATKADELPDDIANANADVCKLAVIGEVSGKPFRITQRELEFYKRENVPLPTDTPYQRILDRFAILNNFQTFSEKCFSCGKTIDSSYRISEGWKPYCEECFREEVL